jgi:hypothetical protein
MSNRLKNGLLVVSLMISAALGAAALAGAASNGGSTTTTTPSTQAAPSTAPSASFPAHGTAAHEDQETAVTGAAADKAKAAAVNYLGGGTAGEVTTDMSGTGYEVTVTKSDGTTAEVHMDSNLNVFQGGPGGFGHG